MSHFFKKTKKLEQSCFKKRQKMSQPRNWFMEYGIFWPLLKVPFFRKCSNLQISQKTILSLNFEIPAHISKYLFSNFKIRIVFGIIFLGDLREMNLIFWKKATFRRNSSFPLQSQVNIFEQQTIIFCPHKKVNHASQNPTANLYSILSRNRKLSWM